MMKSREYFKRNDRKEFFNKLENIFFCNGTSTQLRCNYHLLNEVPLRTKN